MLIYLILDVIIFDFRCHQQQYSNANAACLHVNNCNWFFTGHDGICYHH